MKKSAITSGGASLLEILVCTATAGVALLTRQKCPKATWGKPQDPDAPERPPGRSNDLPERRLNGAYRVPRRICPTALRCPKKSSRCSLARFFRPLRVLRLAASATGGARLRTPYPSPAAGEGPSGQIAAYPTHSLDSVTSCYRFAVTPIKCAAGTLRVYLRRRTD